MNKFKTINLSTISFGKITLRPFKMLKMDKKWNLLKMFMKLIFFKQGIRRREKQKEMKKRARNLHKLKNLLKKWKMNRLI